MSKTRERLIESARIRFYRDGFRNVLLDRILRDVGISKTAFYKHFASKEDLMLAVLDDRSRWLQEKFLVLVRSRLGNTARRQLELLMNVVEEVTDSDQFHGCIFINASMEFPLPHEPAHRSALKNRLAIQEIVHDIAERAGARDPAGLAKELCMVIDGAYTTKQVTASPDTVDTARLIFQRVIDAHLGKEDPPPRGNTARLKRTTATLPKE